MRVGSTGEGVSGSEGEEVVEALWLLSLKLSPKERRKFAAVCNEPASAAAEAVSVESSSAAAAEGEVEAELAEVGGGGLGLGADSAASTSTPSSFGAGPAAAAGLGALLSASLAREPRFCMAPAVGGICRNSTGGWHLLWPFLHSLHVGNFKTGCSAC